MVLGSWDLGTKKPGRVRLGLHAVLGGTFECDHFSNAKCIFNTISIYEPAF